MKYAVLPIAVGAMFIAACGGGGSPTPSPAPSSSPAAALPSPTPEPTPTPTPTPACHGTIRAGKVLSMTEMREIILQLEASEAPHTCPHGRPTMIHMSAELLAREFGRR